MFKYKLYPFNLIYIKIIRSYIIGFITFCYIIFRNKELAAMEKEKEMQEKMQREAERLRNLRKKKEEEEVRFRVFSGYIGLLCGGEHL